MRCRQQRYFPHTPPPSATANSACAATSCAGGPSEPVRGPSNSAHSAWRLSTTAGGCCGGGDALKPLYKRTILSDRVRPPHAAGRPVGRTPLCRCRMRPRGTQAFGSPPALNFILNDLGELLEFLNGLKLLQIDSDHECSFVLVAPLNVSIARSRASVWQGCGVQRLRCPSVYTNSWDIHYRSRRRSGARSEGTQRANRGGYVPDERKSYVCFLANT